MTGFGGYREHGVGITRFGYKHRIEASAISRVESTVVPFEVKEGMKESIHLRWTLRERHLVECVPPPGGMVYVLYPIDGPDLNENLICLFFSPNQLIHLVLS